MSGNHMKVTLINSEKQMLRSVNVSFFLSIFNITVILFPSAKLLSPIKTRQNAVLEQRT